MKKLLFLLLVLASPCRAQFIQYGTEFVWLAAGSDLADSCAVGLPTNGFGGFGVLLPANTGTNGYVMGTDGANPAQWSWNDPKTYLGVDFIINGTSLQSPATFNINGDGNLGGVLNVAGAIQSNTLTASVASGFGFIGTNNSGVIGIQTGGAATIPMSDGVANFDMENITPGTGITIVNATGPPSITISMNGGDTTGQNSYIANNPLHWPQTAKAGITGSFSCGGNDTITGTLTQGISNTANSGVSSVVLGDSSLATNTASFAQGTASHATGWDAVAMGSSDATGTNDCALVNAIASGGYSFAAGAGAEASGSASFAIGNSVGANGTHGVALGENANCDFMSHSFVYGDGSVSTQNDAANQFMVRASGGYKLFATSGGTPDLLLDNTDGLTLNQPVTVNSTEGTQGSNFTSQGSGNVPKWQLGTTGQFDGLNPTGTASAIPVMMGMGSTATMTPAKSGIVVVMMDGDIANTTVNDNSKVRIAFGTGPAPMNGTPATGTTVGPLVNFIITATGGVNVTGIVPVTAMAVITGLSIGTTYWLDAQLQSPLGGFATLTNISFTITEY